MFSVCVGARPPPPGQKSLEGSDVTCVCADDPPETPHHLINDGTKHQTSNKHSDSVTNEYQNTHTHTHTHTQTELITLQESSGTGSDENS